MWGGREGGHGQGTGEALRNALRYSRQPERGRRSNGRGPIPACSVRVAEVEGQEEGDLTGDDRQVVASGQNELAPGPLRARKGWRRNTGSPPEPRRPEEPDVRSTSPVPWELGEGNLPWLPYPGLGDAVDERRGAEERRFSESPEGGAAGGAGLPPCRPKEEMTGELFGEQGSDDMARRRGPGRCVRSAADESLGSERGWPAAPGLAAMTAGGREGSELSGDRRNWQVALSFEEGWDVRASGVGW